MTDRSSESTRDGTSQPALRPYVLERAIAAAHSGIVISDPALPDNPIVYCNPAFEALSGYTAAEVLGRNCRFLQGPDTDPAALDRLRQALREGSVCRLTLKNYRKDGTPFWNELTVAPVRNEEGRLTHHIGVQSDISARIRSEVALRGLNDQLEDLIAERTRALKVAEAKFRAIFENALEGIFQSTPAGRYLEVNPALAQMYGYDSPEDLKARLIDIGRQLYVRPERRTEFLACMERDGYVRDFESQVYRADGRTLWIAENVRRMRAADGSVYFEGLVEDITRRVESEARLRVQEAFLRQVIDTVPNLIFVKDRFGVFLLANQALAAAYGTTPEALVGQPEHRFNSDAEQLAAFHCDDREVIATRRAKRIPEERLTDAQGQTRWLQTIKLPLIDADGEVRVLGVVTDITEYKRYQAQLAYQANHDVLTGLPNRVLLHDRLDQALHRARRDGRGVAVLWVNLDRFQTINDSLGPADGDALLKAVAARLFGGLAAVDTVARPGGDEFVIVLTDLDQPEESAASCARQVQSLLEEPFDLAGQSVVVTASVGIGILSGEYPDAQVLLQQANVALKRAKSQGQGGFQFYTGAMNARALERLALENALRLALVREELLLHYQPQVDLASGRVVGVEALLRWRHPQRGMVPPAEFIPLAEETGLIVPIGAWVLRSACLQARIWREAGLPALRMAVNLSPRQFRQPDLTEMVLRALDQSGLDGRLLKLEITESALMDDLDRALASLRALRERGITLSLDDFGTGYSSLNYLKRLPISQIKIDRSFVRDITNDPDDAAIVQAVIAMAHSLKLQVVAEGVETDAQLARLHAQGCDEIQGYYLSRPLPAGELATLVRHNRVPPLPEAASPGERPVVLLVDDEPHCTAALGRTLRNENCRLLAAHDASEALEQLARQPVAVVISDYRMPGLSGTEFLGRVRALYPRTVRIMISGHGDAAGLAAAINEGAIYKYLAKPLDPDQVRATLREALRLSAVQSQAAVGPEPAPPRLAAPDREWSVLFQPLISLGGQRVAGYEAWLRASDGTATGARDLNAARLGLILARFAKLNLAGLLLIRLPVAALLGEDLSVDLLSRQVRQFRLRPQGVILVLDCEHLVESTATLRAVVARYRADGFQIGLTRLVTGSGVLALWSKLRPDYVLIGRTIVAGLKRDPGRQAFVRALLAMAGQLNGIVIAQDILTQEDYQAVTALGLTLGQGDYVAPAALEPATTLPRRSAAGAGDRAAPPWSVDTVASLAVEAPTLSPGQTVEAVADYFQARPAFDSLAVVDDQGLPMGLVRRAELMNLLLGRFGRELHGRKPVSRVMDRQPLCLEQDLPLTDASRRLTSGTQTEGDFIITWHGRYWAIGRPRDLLRLITELRIAQSRYANPLTQLPGNVPIQERLEECLARGRPFVVAYCDLDHFKPYNDSYGYAKGDQVIRGLAETLLQGVDEAQDFVGHVGGDDFLIVFQSPDWEARCRRILDVFGCRAEAFYSDEDRAQGGLRAMDRTGREQVFPIISLSIGAVVPDLQRCRSHQDIAALASAAKQGAKRQAGNSLFVSRRQGPEAAPGDGLAVGA